MTRKRTYTSALKLGVEKAQNYGYNFSKSATKPEKNKKLDLFRLSIDVEAKFVAHVVIKTNSPNSINEAFEFHAGRKTNNWFVNIRREEIMNWT